MYAINRDLQNLSSFNRKGQEDEPNLESLEIPKNEMSGIREGGRTIKSANLGQRMKNPTIIQTLN